MAVLVLMSGCGGGGESSLWCSHLDNALDNLDYRGGSGLEHWESDLRGELGDEAVDAGDEDEWNNEPDDDVSARHEALDAASSEAHRVYDDTASVRLAYEAWEETLRAAC